jgi:hypothetical protein
MQKFQSAPFCRLAFTRSIGPIARGDQPRFPRFRSNVFFSHMYCAVLYWTIRGACGAGIASWWRRGNMPRWIRQRQTCMEACMAGARETPCRQSTDHITACLDTTVHCFHKDVQY